MRERFIAQGKWYYTLTVVTVGLFAWVPFLHASVVTHNPRARGLAIRYGALALVLAVMVGLTPNDAQGNPTGAAGAVLSTVVTIAAIAIIAMACIQLRPLRMAVYGLNDPHRVAPTDSERAVTEALHARERRQEARALVERQPSLARDLNIGRPDLGGAYDDGGLVELNSAPVELLVSGCGLERNTAERVAEIRRQWSSGFSSVDEVLAYVDVSEREARMLRDRGIVLPA